MNTAVKPVRATLPVNGDGYIGNVAEFPAVVRDEPTWLQSRLFELGVIAMAQHEPKQPPGFYFNYSTASFYLVVITAILGGFWFMYDRIEKAGYERGKLEIELKEVKDRLTLAEDNARRAAMLGAAQSGDAGHTKEKK